MLFGKKSTYFDLGLTEDCHCHLLPGVDDGVKTLDETVAILGRMKADGIRKVTFTSHINPEIYLDNTESLLKDKFDSIRESLPEGIDYTLGAEYMVTKGFETRNPKEFLQFQPGKVLIEMSYLYPSDTMEEAIFNICYAGLIPVVAHPERYLYYSDSLHRFERMHDMGAEFQMNILSLSGAYGPQSLKILKYLNCNGWYTCLGTDTHSQGHFDMIEKIRFKRIYTPFQYESKD